MKKLLLGTSALFGAVALFAGAANAEAPKVTLGGSIDVQAGITSEDSAYDNVAAGVDRRGYSLNNDTELRISVDGKSDNGLGYGAVIELESDVSNDARSSDTNADKTFIYLQAGWGRFELGANNGASQTMKVDAATFARATGGIDGDWWRYASVTQGATGNVAGWIVRPELLVEHGTFSNTGVNQAAEDANKITYYSPRWSGFQVGLTYAPDNGEIGQVGPGNGLGNSNVGGRNVEDIFTGGLNYKNQFGEFGLALSATGQMGDAQDLAAAPQEDLQSYALGGNLTWRGFTFGGSWGTWEDSLESKAAAGNNRDKDFWNLGAAYDFGPFGVSATYFQSEVEDGVGVTEHEFNNLVIGADYMLAPGLVPYIEASFFEFDQNGASTVSPTADNDGTVVIIGTQLTF